MVMSDVKREASTGCCWGREGAGMGVELVGDVGDG